MFGVILKATNSSFQKGITFCRTIYVKKAMKLLAFIFEQPSYKLADYEKYRLELSERNIHEITHLISNIDQNIKDITEAIMQAADKSIPNKIVTIKPSDHPWITCHIKHDSKT